ncbi:MAG: outer membrane lipoprotein carrier protein LolA [Acidobacteriota bacterium]
MADRLFCMQKYDLKGIFIFFLVATLSYGLLGTEEKHTIYTDEQTEAFFKKFDFVQKETKTIQATFVEKKELKLLEEPVVSKGRFYFTSPSQALWEYQNPEEKTFLLTKNDLISYYPKEKKAEKVNIKRFSGQVFKFFAVGQISKDLKDYYNIEVSNNNNSKKIIMTLRPKKRRAKKRVDVVRIWIDKTTLQPYQIQYVEMDGDKTTLTFDNLKINEEISAEIYKLNIPPDVEIKEGFSEFSDKGK